MTDNSIEVWSEDNNELVATAKSDGDGSAIHLYFGVKGNRAYYSIPVITKQPIVGGTQPILTFAPDVSDQSFAVAEGEAFNIQIALDANSDIVNMYGEVDAPTWAVLATRHRVRSLVQHQPSQDRLTLMSLTVKLLMLSVVSLTSHVTINVTEVAYTNTKSLSFDGSSTWLQGNPVNMTALDRASNGDGNAWTISMWVKPNSSTGTQTLMVYGAGDDYNGGAITLKQNGGTSLVLNYGTVYNNIILVCGNALQLTLGNT